MTIFGLLSPSAVSRAGTAAFPLRTSASVVSVSTRKGMPKLENGGSCSANEAMSSSVERGASPFEDSLIPLLQRSPSGLSDLVLRDFATRCFHGDTPAHRD